MTTEEEDIDRSRCELFQHFFSQRNSKQQLRETIYIYIYLREKYTTINWLFMFSNEKKNISRLSTFPKYNS